jgi:tRNA nucleotidyltransferase (CCA-adding enzyme)
MTEYTIKELCDSVLERITPNDDERERVKILAEATKSRVYEALKDAGLEADVNIEGSFAKDTWISGRANAKEADVDIFVLYQRTTERKVVEDESLRISRNTLEKWDLAKRIGGRYAEHPYIEAYVDGVRMNIVPGYRVKRGEWITAVDRTPFHTEYVKARLESKKDKDAVRLLKKFMTGVGVYGAEIKVHGFSGYLCELLTIHYHGFLEVLNSASKWRTGQIIDIEGHYDGRLDEARKVFNAPLIIVDPVDERRNAAAAVSIDRFKEFIAASEIFLSNPNRTFFYPPEIKPASNKEIKKLLVSRGSDLVFVVFDAIDVVPDVLWGQLYKTLGALRNMIEECDFKVIRTLCWSDEKRINVFLFEVENYILSPSKKHIGPPIETREAGDFIKEHFNSKHVVCGPWIENGRWTYEIRRKYVNLIELLREKLREGGKEIGVSNRLIGSMKASKVLRNAEIVELHHGNKEFAKAFTKFLSGRPQWLSLE